MTIRLALLIRSKQNLKSSICKCKILLKFTIIMKTIKLGNASQIE